MIDGFKVTAERIKSHVESGTWSEPFAVVRRNLLRWEKEQTGTLQCFVVPLQMTYPDATRERKERRYQVGVYLLQSIRGKTPDEDLAREDALCKLVDQLEEHCEQLRKESPPVRIANDQPRVPFDYEAADKHLFLAGFGLEVFDV